jgi:deoxyribonuclease-1
MKSFVIILLASIALISILSGERSHAGQTQSKDPLKSYYHMLSQFWGDLYARGGDTLYCGKDFGRNKGSEINAEHVFPMAWVAYSLKCGRRNQCRRNNTSFRAIETDMHNIWPARKDVNSARRSYRPAIIKGEHYEFGRCDFEINKTKRLMEPRTAVRGEIARSMFYMHDRYDLYLKPQLVTLLKKWNRQDPPNREERRRNDMIESLQGSRNRFIDQHNLIDSLNTQ